MEKQMKTGKGLRFFLFLFLFFSFSQARTLSLFPHDAQPGAPPPPPGETTVVFGPRVLLLSSTIFMYKKTQTKKHKNSRKKNAAFLSLSSLSFFLFSAPSFQSSISAPSSPFYSSRSAIMFM